MTVSTCNVSDVSLVKGLDQCRRLHLLHGALIRHSRYLLVACFPRVAQLRMRVTSPRETVTRLGLSRSSDHKRLVTSADDFLDKEVFKLMHSLGQGVFDYRATAAGPLEATGATALPTFSF